MEENKEAMEAAGTPEARKKSAEELKAELDARMAEVKAKAAEARLAMGEGKGRLKLEKPITAGDEEIVELVYDFTELTGMEYADALDSDKNASTQFFNGNNITNRQALAIFARAAAKQSDKADARDIMEQIGITDAAAAIQLAMLFFTASTRAGRLRITRM